MRHSRVNDLGCLCNQVTSWQGVDKVYDVANMMM